MSKIARNAAVTLAAVTLAAVTLAALTAYAALASDETQYGEELSTAEVVRIGALLENPESFVDKKVKVAGLVDDVCPMMGCWIDILDERSKSTIRFKVEDGVIAFPVEARGSQVVAEGVLRKHEMSREQAVAYLRHLAEEKGEPFDESSVTAMDVYQIEGLGAEIAAP